MRGLCSLLASLCLTASLLAQSEVADAQIVEVAPNRITLQIGTEKTEAADGPETRIWIGKKPSTREFLQAGMAVRVRMKSGSPAVIREIADRATAAWLEKIRKEPQTVELVKATGKDLEVKLADGTPFKYRMTDKSKIRLTNGDPSELASLKVGQQLFVKGRLLSNLDTWVVEVQDTPYPAAPAKSGSSRASSGSKASSKPAAIPNSGKLEGTVLGYLSNLAMLDILVGTTTIHITITSDTKWYLRGKRTNPSAAQKFVPVKVTYKRDRAGKIVASRVDLG